MMDIKRSAQRVGNESSGELFQLHPRMIWAFMSGMSNIMSEKVRLSFLEQFQLQRPNFEPQWHVYSMSRDLSDGIIHLQQPCRRLLQARYALLRLLKFSPFGKRRRWVCKVQCSVRSCEFIQNPGDCLHVLALKFC